MSEDARRRLPADLATVMHRPGKVQIVASRAAQVAKLERLIAEKHPKADQYALQLVALKAADEEDAVAAAAVEAHRAAKAAGKA